MEKVGLNSLSVVGFVEKIMERYLPKNYNNSNSAFVGFVKKTMEKYLPKNHTNSNSVFVIRNNLPRV